MSDAIAMFVAGIAGLALVVAAASAVYAYRQARAAERQALAAERTLGLQAEALRTQATQTEKALELAERSAKASEESAASSRSLFEVGERAWVSRKYTVAATRSLPEGGLKLDIVTELLNTGKTPALNLLSGQAVEVLSEIPETVNYPRGPGVEPHSIITLGPGLTCKFSQTISLSPSEVTDVRGNTAIVCVYGQCQYDDFLNVNHTTGWFLKYQPTTNDFCIAARHNRMT